MNPSPSETGLTRAPPAMLTPSEVLPTITTQAASQRADELAECELHCHGMRYPFTYQWRKDGADLAGRGAPVTA